MIRLSTLQKSVGWLTALGLLTVSVNSRATEHTLKLEPGVAMPMTAPQSELFDVGAAQTFKIMFGLTRFLDIGPTAGFLFLPARTSAVVSGTAWSVGAGVRLKRPHDLQTANGVSAWLDADLLYVRTGDLNRPSAAAAVGLALPVGDSRAFWVGPFVRYMQTLQLEKAGFDTGDAQVVTLGVSLELGRGRQAEGEVRTVIREVIVTKEVIRTVIQEVVREVQVCPDRDKDGIPDGADKCPDVGGATEDFGCPPYKKVVVNRDTLELKEKLYFAWDDAEVHAVSFPALDEVVQALNANKGVHVQIEGHADASGDDGYNQRLSENRAKAVRHYLTTHGIAEDRLTYKGFSSSVPTDTNKTAAGRENNRRVEFAVHFIDIATGGRK